MMITEDDWELRFHNEIQMAENARNLGNEGMARVCARRAAGIVIGEYFRRKGLPDDDSSAYNRLRKLQNLTGMDDQIKTIAGHFLMRITPENVLPIEVDLLAEVYWLSKELTGE